MTLPTATYRLQFRSGVDFDRAAALAPYLRRLGISHLYASPIFQAMPGSTHGYDVTDHNMADASLGGAEGFLRMSHALREHELGLILDIVPNHMAASPINPWWRDVLRWGAESPFAGHFDIDWSAPKLLVTVLGRPYGEALEAGEFALGVEADGLVWRYYEHAFPLHPETWGLALGAGEQQGAAGWAERFADERARERLEARLAELSRDTGLLHRVHEAQPWQLTYWRAARDMLTHRRFFEITDLVGVRVEDEAVFDDVHRLLFEMVADGHVSGIRVDHVDGLADPAGYLRMLKEKAPGDPPVWVEKILAADEPLDRDWPIEGTTGYEFARAVAAAVTDPAGVGALDAAYADFRGEPPDYHAMLREAKHEILTRNLAAELERLTALAVEALAGDPDGRDWGPDSLRRAILALATALPVYRTYLGGGETAGPADDRVLDGAEREALERADLDDPAPVSLLIRVLRSDDSEAAGRFRTRFQQTTGALMAKAVEDTLFYRFNRLLSTNEVGSEPDHPTLDAAAFHAEMEERLSAQPHGLSVTATHDTKRGEDARMRIAAIGEAPDGWASGIERLEAIVRDFARDTALPEPEARWTFYQALLGAWEPEDPALAERIAAFLVKAAREAKQTTSWVAQDEAYEGALAGFAERAVGDVAFREAFEAIAKPYVTIGGRKSLAQLALKLTAPGVPDVYQGTERADLSLVDPDNRREVDFALRERALDAPGGDFDGTKTALLHAGLLLRRAQPDLFAHGDYVACEVEAPPGSRAVGFARRHGEHVLAVAVELSGSAGDGPLRLRLAGTEPLEVLWAWPREPAPLEAGVLDLGTVAGAGPVWITLLRRGSRI